MNPSCSDLKTAGNVQLLVFRLDDRLHALPLAQVRRVIRSADAAPLPHAPAVVLGVLDIQGEIVPLMNTRGQFGLEKREIGIDDQFIMARTARRTIALLVDGIQGTVERPAEDILRAQRILPGLGRLEGVVQLDDGLTLIHDMDRFLSLDEEEALDRALTMEPAYEKQGS